MMEWTTIDYNGTDIQAADFLDGVLLRDQRWFGLTHIPGYYIQQPTGDMDGPQLRPREEQRGEFEIVVMEK